jgi:hypothetical protein
MSCTFGSMCKEYVGFSGRSGTAKGPSRFGDGCSDLTQSALQLLFDEIHRRRRMTITRRH